MLRVVEEACVVAPDHSKGTIIIESDRIDDLTCAHYELTSSEARLLALDFAVKKEIVDPRINGNLSTVYPVNATGIPLDALIDEKGNTLSPDHPQMRITAYRIDVPVCRRLV